MNAETLGILVGALTIVCIFLAFVIAFISVQVRKANVAKWEMLFKQDLLDQGLSIDEIERLLAIGNHPSKSALKAVPIKASPLHAEDTSRTIDYVPASRPLAKSANDRMLAGVLGGIAESFAIDSTLVRIAFVTIALLTGGLPILVYIVAAIVMPTAGNHSVA
jgi:phage shock protein PspC (stress-responsive transcriptional regulator)